ncbi:allantoate amidohydrolase [Rudaeicoccus suwonensis]|uniref:N-carbamoyl-L-amino-acid hydrolase n=1 Tax=Rudaeicoccus suwonensis TaxID=657409 RepID=A0A561E3E1_9MICO|nr:allantoate amidohydrolase [Rudaeicoccus suwonensis]TWE10132.1 N-carbamoyl-L-amino-acid hydrolase [Rudaeicoccus suwonensis]
MSSSEFDRMWDELHPVGRVASGGYRRFAWTAEDHTLREWFAGECTRRGLQLTQDRMGNQWAWWGDPDADGPGVVIGSHLDSVPDGGAYDGPLGVVSALATVDALRANGFAPKRPIAVVNFGDEEGARFGVACAGSRVITGAMTRERALGLADADGITMAEALTQAGRTPEHIGRDDETLRRIGCFVELHVEQGRALADLDPATAAVAIGTDIWPHGRWRIDLPGVANHAGTTRLVDRHDAMLSAAQVVLTARAVAAENGCVATTGKIEVEPGGVNAIPSHVRLWLDARGSDEAAVQATVAAIGRETSRFGGTLTEESWTATTPFDSDLAGRLRGVLGESTPMLGTGAGHDAGILATAGVSTAMLFVRNPTGVSHSPEEFAERDDCHRGVEALTAVTQDLAS